MTNRPLTFIVIPDSYNCYCAIAFRLKLSHVAVLNDFETLICLRTNDLSKPKLGAKITFPSQKNYVLLLFETRSLPLCLSLSADGLETSEGKTKLRNITQLKKEVCFQKTG